MSKQITRKNLSNKPVIKIGYCAATFILRYFNRIGYMSGIYGWNCDIYEFDAAYIVTGYRFTGLSGKYVNSELIKRINDDAGNYTLKHEISDGYESVENHMTEVINKIIDYTLKH